MSGWDRTYAVSKPGQVQDLGTLGLPFLPLFLKLSGRYMHVDLFDRKNKNVHNSGQFNDMIG
ncbi:hypothetical protein C8029_03095 [Roseobacter sp. TSBP12]|nr:hypothetical protein C8029_03095 [Roseobacter sp. TSBP12]